MLNASLHEVSSNFRENKTSKKNIYTVCIQIIVMMNTMFPLNHVNNNNTFDL